MPTPFNELYKEFRNRLRRYKPASIVAAALNALRKKHSTSLEQLKAIPWQTMLVVKWALQDPMMADSKGSEISEAEFDRLRQELWRLGDRIEMFGAGALEITLRRVIYPQMEFQRRMSPAFVRSAALIDTLTDNHPLKSGFREKIGMSPSDFIALAFSLYCPVVEGRISIAKSLFQPLGPRFGSACVQNFLNLVAQDYRQLTEFCRKLPNLEHRMASEYFEFTPIKRYPFLVTERGLECWHPAIFYRGMEEMVHLNLSLGGSSYIERFSKVFEAHVLNELRPLPCQTYDEDDLREFVGADSKVPDALISCGSSNVLVESKAGLFDETTMLVNASDIFSHKTRSLHTAVRQAWNAVCHLRNSSRTPLTIRNAKIDYLLVVTNRELSIGNGTRLSKMTSFGKFEYPSELAKTFLPIENVYILSIDDFERLMAAARNGLEIDAFLDRCISRDKSPSTGKYTFDQHLTTERVPFESSSILKTAIELAEARLTSAL